MRVPSSTPGGMLTDSVRSRVTRPEPRAGRARVLDHLAAALAGRAGALEREEALRVRGPCRAPPQVAQVFGLVPALAPVPEQASQVTEVGMRICAVLPAIGLLERDLHVVAQVGAALAAAAATGAPPPIAEDVLEDVGEGRAEVGAEAVRRRHAALLEGGVAEAVVGGALLRVLQDS